MSNELLGAERHIVSSPISRANADLIVSSLFSVQEQDLEQTVKLFPPPCGS